MNCTEAEQLARQLMNEYGLLDWTFAWDRAKQRAGRCQYYRKRITLSVYYVLLNEDRPDDIRDTILHEIAHAIAGWRAAHGGAWKAACVQVGARPERCFNSSVVRMPTGRLKATCPGCGRTFYRHRRPRRGTWRCCGACGRALLFAPAS